MSDKDWHPDPGIEDIDQVIFGLQVIKKYAPRAGVECHGSEKLIVTMNAEAMESITPDDRKELRRLGWRFDWAYETWVWE